ncbi:MAG: sigma-54 dependent transcriptional regulator [Gemmataceae bacterium]|nr:sigma-54 dependent transcriptional regulator [Gemmataceae bacterium]MDW8265513.1 sigma 54-interacting transcriptional regulator [Gemmataceae bacterium]
MVYAISVLWYVYSTPEIGFRSMFKPVVLRVYPDYLLLKENQGLPGELVGATITRVGPYPIDAWPQLIRALYRLHSDAAEAEDPVDWDSFTHVRDKGQDYVRVVLHKPGDAEPLAIWCVVGRPPIDVFLPSVLWFVLKLGLLTVGALVFWKRPTDRSAAHFLLLCIVTVGAYMGGYHWSKIAPQPLLLLVFTSCSVLLPAVSLHFYLNFPRPKWFVERYPRWTLTVVYGPPLAFLLGLIPLTQRVRDLVIANADGAEINAALRTVLVWVMVYLPAASLAYLGSVCSLVHSYWRAASLRERNQVKWILYGALAALFPIGYTLYLIVFDPEGFGAGAATWPMFAASLFFTGAFTVSITRYRLMQLDQIISSGMTYFLISFLAGVVYYGLVFLGLLLVGSQVISGPSLEQALWVSSTALILMIVLNLVRSRITKALDRHFDREKRQLDRTLQQLGQTVEQLVDPPTLAQRLLHASADLLGVSRGAVYLAEGDPPLYRLAHALGPAPPLAELAPGCPLVDALSQRGTVAVSGPLRAMPPVQAQLRLLGGEIAQALMHEGRLLALLVLGAKESGPYQPEDRNLLTALAQLMALALENAEGHRTIEALNRELQAKVEKISEQQRRILSLQSQLSREAGDSKAGPGSDGSGARPAGEALRPGPTAAPGIVGSSPAIRRVLQLVHKVSAVESAVLIRGESGTGKELLAQALHAYSPRVDKPFVRVHCAALAPGLLESELFGHVKGAFTGAHRDKVGRFELADGGTLFLDEIGDISLEVQTKLLRVLQEMTFERVGSSEPVHVDVRLITATHQNLEELIRQGRFREDLYYRLNVISIEVPPLRERREDIPELAQHFLEMYAPRCGKVITQIDDDVIVILKGFSWPGNVRQLENVIQRAVVVAEGPTLRVGDLPSEIVADAAAPWMDGSARVKGRRGADRAERLRREREELVRALAAAGGNKAEAARALGLARSTFLSRLKKHGLS